MIGNNGMVAADQGCFVRSIAVVELADVDVEMGPVSAVAAVGKNARLVVTCRH